MDWGSEVLRIAELKDATTLADIDLNGVNGAGGSGVCTECHHGENVFIVAPDNPVWTKVLRTADLGADFTTRVEASNDIQEGRPRYIPITGVNGATRAGWSNQFRPMNCGGKCHEQPNLFPNLPVPMPPTCGSTLATIANCYR